MRAFIGPAQPKYIARLSGRKWMSTTKVQGDFRTRAKRPPNPPASTKMFGRRWCLPAGADPLFFGTLISAVTSTSESFSTVFLSESVNCSATNTPALSRRSTFEAFFLDLV